MSNIEIRSDITVICDECRNEAEHALCGKHRHDQAFDEYEDGRKVGYEEGLRAGRKEAEEAATKEKAV